MSRLIITCDIDWAPEWAISETLRCLDELKSQPTVFMTHPSDVINLHQEDIGLHPYFDPLSSHGQSLEQVVETVSSFPYTIPAFRCHRFKSCNQSMQLMYDMGMRISSNVCTDLQDVSPFVSRYGMIEFPIFMEDGGYLWRHGADLAAQRPHRSFANDQPKVLLIHPMHFVLNSPNFDFMRQIKQSCTRDQWRKMDENNLRSLRFQGFGIADLMMEILMQADHFISLRDYYNKLLSTEFKHLLQSKEHSLL